MVKNQTNNRGFTLVELIISIAILALIIVAISGVMFSNNNVFRKNKSDLDVQNTALDTLNVIENDVMQARHMALVTDSGDVYICESDKNLIEAGGINVTYTDSLGASATFQINASDPVSTKIDTISTKGADAEEKVYDSLTSSNRVQVDSFYQKVKMMSDDEITVYKQFFASLPAVATSYSSYDTLTSPADLNVKQIILAFPTYVNSAKDTAVVVYEFGSDTLSINKSYVTNTSYNTFGVYTEYIDTSGYSTVTVNTDSNTLEFNIDFERNDRVYHGSRVVTIRNAHVLNDAN